jgi:cephalosporin-C deacetylase
VATFDMPLDELRRYKPERTEPTDFDAFWSETLAESRGLAAPPRFEPFASSLDARRVRRHVLGFAGQPIKRWLLAPAGRPVRSRRSSSTSATAAGASSRTAG